MTWPFWPVRTRPITGQHGPAGRTGQHRPGRVRRTAPAHSTRAAQRHTHSQYTHTHTHTHAHTRTASPGLATVLYCVQQCCQVRDKVAHWSAFWWSCAPCFRCARRCAFWSAFFTLVRGCGAPYNIQVILLSICKILTKIVS